MHANMYVCILNGILIGIIALDYTARETVVLYICIDVCKDTQ